MTVAALWTNHRSLATEIAKSYWLPGSERQDVEQEALIGLWVAARTFDPARNVKFKTFASVVIRRRLATLLRLALVDKRGPLNTAIRVVPNSDGELVDITDHLSRDIDSVERIVVGRETLDRLVVAAARLSPLERHALSVIVNGDPYRDDKQVNNAAARARAKLRQTAPH
jgi:RNA polymerase sporulation-specific sigma factor